MYVACGRVGNVLPPCGDSCAARRLCFVAEARINLETQNLVQNLAKNRFGVGSGVQSDGMILVSVKFADFGTFSPNYIFLPGFYDF